MKIFQKSENLPKMCLIKCLKGHKSLGSLCSVVKTLIVSGVRAREQGTRSPIELFWTAKKCEQMWEPFPKKCEQLWEPSPKKCEQMWELFPKSVESVKFPQWKTLFIRQYCSLLGI